MKKRISRTIILILNTIFELKIFQSFPLHPSLLHNFPSIEIVYNLLTNGQKWQKSQL